MKVPWIFILRRTVFLFPVLLGVSFIAFVILNILPGDPALMLVGERASKVTLENMRKKMGLDKSLIQQYGIYLKKLLVLDLGNSLVSREPVLGALLKRLPATVLLASASIVVASLLGIFCGTLCAIYRGGYIDMFLTSLTLLGISMPVFWVGLMLILIFAVTWQIFPPSTEEVGLEYLILPVLTLSMRSASYIARITRTSVLDVLSLDHVRTARAKGLTPMTVTLKHVLFNAFIPIITVVGLDFASYLNGSVITETIFNWPGVGRYTMNAILQRDYPVVQGMVILGAFVFVSMNLLVDLSYGILDPKIRDDYLQGRF
ncbi:ABC transporter permease [Candidatus Riflebacteria bacterium]